MLHETPHNENMQITTPDYLVRPRVDNLLKEALQKPLVTVIAGAGYGKTLAVLSVMESTQYEHAWLPLSELDNAPVVIWKRMIIAIGANDPGLTMRLNALGFPDSPVSFYRFLQLVEDARKNRNRFVLVLDDFYIIRDKTVLAFFERVITANISNLAIVLISREKPSISLAGMLSKGLMMKITEDDLRFTQEEMEAYYHMRDIALDTDTLAGLYAETEGWIFAIYLIGFSLRRASGTDLSLVSHSKIDIFALIEEEIFGAASDALKKSLTILALLECIPADLLAGLMKDKPEVLAELSQLSLLIRYDLHTDSYRMHPLLREFLSWKKHTLTEAEIAGTHCAAAQWYHSHNRLAEAVNHYRECGRYHEIFDILLSIRTHVGKEDASFYITLIEEAPSEIIEARPIMRVAKVKYLFDNNRIQEAQIELAGIREEYETLPPTQANLAILGEVHVLLALISFVKQNQDFVAHFKKAAECLPEGSALIDSHYQVAEGINVTGIQEPGAGELKRHLDAMFEAAPYATAVMNGCGYGMEYLNATDVAFMTGKIQDAEKHAYETIYRARQRQQNDIEFMANFYLIRIFMYKGDCAKISLLLSGMKEQINRAEYADCKGLYDVIEGWFFVKIGQPEKVAKWIMHEEETRKIFPPVILGREYLVRSDCLLEEGRDLELLGFMQQSNGFYEERGILFARIQNRITESIIHHYLGNRKESIEALETAYALSHANDLIIQYIEYGSRMRTVVHAAMQDAGCTIPKAWLQSIHTKASTYAKRLGQVKKDYQIMSLREKPDMINLSKRELEVLSCLCNGFTREEIADHCNLSPNTLRSMLQIIFQKLGAINSLDAVRIATTMELV